MPRYSSVVMDHFQSPRNVGKLDSPDVVCTAGTPYAGPFMVFHLRVHDSLVTDVRFQTYGCGAAIAAGSLLTTLIKDKYVAECLELSEQELLDGLDGLPPDKSHCTAIAIKALQNGLSQFAR